MCDLTTIISIDCESNGLRGQTFAAAAVVRRSGVTIASFVARCPIEGTVVPWVANNVIPKLSDLKITHSSEREMRDAFWAFWEYHRKGAVTIAHMGIPVESRFFDACVEDAPTERMFSGPYPLHEVATRLLLAGEDPTSVDSYNKKYKVSVPYDGSAHHPLYDAYASAVCWEHMTQLRA